MPEGVQHCTDPVGDGLSRHSGVTEMLVGCLLSQQQAIVYFRDGSAQTILRAATLRQKLLIKLFISPSHSILTPDQPVGDERLLHFAVVVEDVVGGQLMDINKAKKIFNFLTFAWCF